MTGYTANVEFLENSEPKTGQEHKSDNEANCYTNL